MTTYRNDPRWFEARYADICYRCGKRISKGERAFWYPRSKTVYCAASACGDLESRQFAAAAQDEDQYNGTW